MKKTRILPAVVLATILGLAACSGGGQNKSNEASQGGGDQSNQSQPISQEAQEKITITQLPKTIFVGDQVILSASVEGVAWKSSDETIATVTDGVFKALKAGKVTITASKDGYKDGTVNVTIQLVPIAVTAKDDKTSLLAGETVQLSADRQGVTWKSSDEAVATVSATGLVTGVAFGEANITAELEGYKAGSIKINVTRPAAALEVDMTTDADHYSADGWWSVTTNTFGMAMESGGGATPITGTTSWDGSEADPYISAFGAGDKETVKFTATKATKAEIVVNLGNSDEVVLSEAVTIKLNNKAIDLTGKTLAAHEGQSGNELVFADFSLGEQDLVQGENTLVFEMLSELAPSLNYITFYGGDATLAVVAPAAKETIAVEEAELKIIQGEKAGIKSATTGLSYVSSDVSIATVSDNGEVTAVAVGRTTITVKKEGMYSVRVTIIVNPVPVSGQIVLEAEDAAEVVAGESAYTKTEDGGSSGGGTHSGSAYISGWQGDAATLTFTFESEKAGTYELSVTGSAPIMGEGAFSWADSAEIKLNDVAVTVAGEFPAAENYQAETVTLDLGEVTLVKGSNTLVINISGSLPTLDVFKLTELK